MRGWLIAALVALCLSFPSSARAQTAHSLEAGFLTELEEGLFLLGYRATVAKPGGVGVDFSISTLPQFIGEGGVILLPHLDITTSVPLGSRSWLLPRAGLSAIAGFGDGGGGAVAGFNFGIGLLGRVGEHTGVRLDVTHMRFLSGGESVGLWALTFGFAWIK